MCSQILSEFELKVPFHGCPSRIRFPKIKPQTIAADLIQYAHLVGVSGPPPNHNVALNFIRPQLARILKEDVSLQHASSIANVIEALAKAPVFTSGGYGPLYNYRKKREVDASAVQCKVCRAI